MLGSYADFIHQHDVSRRLKWRLGWDQSEAISLVDPTGKRTEAFAKGSHIDIESEIASVREAPHARSLRYRLDGYEFALVPKTRDDTAFDLTSEGNFRFRRTQGRPWQIPGPVKSYAFPDQVRTFYQNSDFLALLVAAFERQIDRTYYLGPLREYPKREYIWTRVRPSDVGQKKVSGSSKQFLQRQTVERSAICARARNYGPFRRSSRTG
jgi:hypothetical protein